MGRSENKRSEALSAQLMQCKEIITNFLTYPSPSFKGKVLEAALYTESIFEYCNRFPPSTLFTKYIDPSYPVYSFPSISSALGLCVRRRIDASCECC